jgi:hypothetical protein
VRSWPASLLGPAILGRLSSMFWILEATQRQASILNFVYWLGLLLLMFLSGAETQQLFSRDERREVGWLAIVGTGIPCPWVSTGPMAGWPDFGGPQWWPNFLDHHPCDRRCRYIGSGSFQDLRRSKNTSHSFRAPRARSRGFRRHSALARSGRGNSAGWQDSSQPTTDVVPPVDHGWVLRAGFDDCSADRKASEQVQVQRFRKTVSGGVCDRRPPRVWRGSGRPLMSAWSLPPFSRGLLLFIRSGDCLRKRLML